MANPDYFTVAELQALPDCDDFTEAQILPAAAYFTSIVEREVGVSFVPRTHVETLSGNGGTALLLGSVPTSLTSVTVDGATVTVGLLDATAGVLRYDTGTTAFTSGVGNVVITYTAGSATCPADIKDAVMWATRDRLIAQSQESGSWDRKSSETSDFGTVNYVLAGEKRPTGYPDLDALIASYLRTTPSYGFA